GLAQPEPVSVSPGHDGNLPGRKRRQRQVIADNPAQGAVDLHVVPDGTIRRGVRPPDNIDCRCFGDSEQDWGIVPDGASQVDADTLCIRYDCLSTDYEVGIRGDWRNPRHSHRSSESDTYEQVVSLSIAL